jgi:NAD(P)-dependent dehydrogenase (short-subunit alcohol dehydrogenase family)
VLEQTADEPPNAFDGALLGLAEQEFYLCEDLLDRIQVGAVRRQDDEPCIDGADTYSATNAASRSFARTWTKEFKDRGIRVNTLSPGPIDTPIIDSQADTKEAADGIRAFFSSIISLNRMGQPAEVAAAALFLASDESSFVAGIELSVDGGMGQV